MNPELLKLVSFDFAKMFGLYRSVRNRDVCHRVHWSTDFQAVHLQRMDESCKLAS